MPNNPVNTNGNEVEIRQLIEDWAGAVRRGDIKAILAHQSYTSIIPSPVNKNIYP
jgi:ketosteroid isomerase-like protein